MKTLCSIEIAPNPLSEFKGVRVARLAITRCNQQGETEVLLAKNIKKKEWELPGGQLEPWECKAVGVAREVGEEVNGVVIIQSGFVKYLSYTMVGGARHGLPYEAHVARGEDIGGHIYAKSEVEDTQWVVTEAVPHIPNLRPDVIPAMTAVSLL